MHFIVGKLVEDHRNDQHTNRHAEGKAHNIDQGKSFIPPYVSESGEQIIS
jgi:hypothetical protein